MKSILITGGAGFIGSHVVRLFVKKYPEYKIYNLLGELVHERAFLVETERVEVNLPNLSAGIYNVYLEIDNQTVVKKFTRLNN